MAQKGTISIEKTGEVFFGVSVSGSENEHTIYQPLYEVSGLAGAKYEIHAAEDVITPDGTLRYAKGDLIDTVTTDADGYDTSGASHVGIYVGNGMMIHCGNPISYASIESNYWQQHFYCFGRIRN